ncbi:hypothetical protein CEXT_344571 [Caerostris extrusa]|uniref:Uncharacterized protein n=1 Tax=Caerostris extrusa TaxID=172846 RepID=A0AAV4WDR8_CAEEX|nr:hypothetical protein CEXT_344571 [Caerostris extrusa]
MRNRKIFGKREQMTSDLSRTRDCTPNFKTGFSKSFRGFALYRIEQSTPPSRGRALRRAIYPAASGNDTMMTTR